MFPLENKSYQITAVIGLLILCLVAIGSNYLLWSQVGWEEVVSLSWVGEDALYDDALWGKGLLMRFQKI